MSLVLMLMVDLTSFPRVTRMWDRDSLLAVQNWPFADRKRFIWVSPLNLLQYLVLCCCFLLCRACGVLPLVRCAVDITLCSARDCCNVSCLMSPSAPSKLSVGHHPPRRLQFVLLTLFNFTVIAVTFTLFPLYRPHEPFNRALAQCQDLLN